MRMPATLSLVLVLAAVVPAAAQEKPDFTGTWVLVTPTGAANVPTNIVVRESFKRESVTGVALPSPIVSMHVERRGGGDVMPGDSPGRSPPRPTPGDGREMRLRAAKRGQFARALTRDQR